MPVDAADLPALIFGVDIVRISGVLKSPESVAVINIFPPRVGNSAGVRGIANPTAVVLQAAIHMIGIRIVSADMIELRNRQIELMLPAGSSVVAAPQAAIVAGNDNIRIVRIDPDVVKVAVGVGYRAEALTSIHAEQQWGIGLENFVLIFRIDDQIREVERTPDHVLAGVQTIPVLAAIIGAE